MYDVTQWAYSKLTPGVVAERLVYRGDGAGRQLRVGPLRHARAPRDAVRALDADHVRRDARPRREPPLAAGLVADDAAALDEDEAARRVGRLEGVGVRA